MGIQTAGVVFWAHSSIVDDFLSDVVFCDSTSMCFLSGARLRKYAFDDDFFSHTHVLKVFTLQRARTTARNARGTVLPAGPSAPGRSTATKDTDSPLPTNSANVCTSGCALSP